MQLYDGQHVFILQNHNNRYLLAFCMIMERTSVKVVAIVDNVVDGFAVLCSTGGRLVDGH